MLCGVERHIDPGHLPDFPGPHATAVNYVFRLDFPSVCNYTRHSPIGLFNPGHFGLFPDACAAHFSPFGHRHRRVNRIRPTIIGRIESGQNIVSFE